MSATLHHRSAEVFIAALDIDPRDRQIFINEQCAGNEAIKAEVEALLRADEEAKSFLAPPRRPAAAEDDFTLTKNLVGKRIGGYHVTRWIASGGMGSIYEAIQESLGRTVALKVLKHGVVDAKSLRRFEYEAQLLARLRHPGIAQILEAGFFEDCEGWLGASGTRAPYFAMEFVPEAVTITDYVHDHHLDVPRRLKLIAAVCDAVHHGHLCGITHRDLKPANILVMNNAQDLPQPKIIDFGVARAARTEGGLTTMQTAVGQLVGTLAYMSPEQCAADPDDIDIRSDIYSLGVVLYEVLCGRLPYVVPAANPLEAVRVVQQKPPSKLSSIDPALRGDLEAIVFKALEKDRSRRYQSAEGLAKDLRRFIHHEPVSARAPSVMYQLRYFARRNKPLMAGVVSAFVLLVAGVLATSWGLVRARRAERIADVRRAAAEREAYLANIAAADSAIAAMDGGGALARLQETPVTQRGWEWYHLASRADRSRFQLDGPISPVRMASSRGGKSIIGVFDDGSVSRWDVADRRIRWSVANAFPRNTDSSSGVVCVAPNARRFAVIVQSDVWIFDADNGKKLGSLPITSSHREALNIAFHPDGRHLAVSTTRDASLWNVDTALEEHVVDLAGYVFGIAFSADGRLLAHSDREGVTLRDSLTFDYVDRLPIQFGASYLQFSPDGASLAACNGSTVTILDIASHRVTATLTGHQQRVESLAWSPDSRILATGAIDRTIRLWDVRQGTLIDVLLGHAGRIVDLAFVNGDKWLASASNDGRLKIWDAEPRPDVNTLNVGHSFVAPPITWSNDGRRFLSSSAGVITRWDSASLKADTVFQPPMMTMRFRQAVLSPDGKFIATSNAQSHCVLIDAGDQHAVWTSPEADDTVPCYAFSNDGRWIASPAPDHSIRIRDARTGLILHTTGANPEKILYACFSPDDRKIATSEADGVLRVWNTGESVSPLWIQEHLTGLACIAWSPDGRRVATVCTDQTALIFEATSGHKMLTLTGLQDGGWSIAFSPDGRRIATGSKDRLIRIWDANDGRELLKLRGHTGTVMALSWSPDGRRLLSGSYDGTIKVWESTGGPTSAAFFSH